MERAAATRATCRAAFSGDTSGSSPLAEVVSMSPGTVFSPVFAKSAVTRSISALDVGPALEPPELEASYGTGTVLDESAGSVFCVADGRPWKYLAAVKFCPSRAEADHVAVALDQAAAGLVRKHGSGDADEAEREQ